MPEKMQISQESTFDFRELSWSFVELIICYCKVLHELHLWNRYLPQ